jgi:Resolvase, N terminal domain
MIDATPLLLPQAQNCSALWGFPGGRKGVRIVQWGTTTIATSGISHFPQLSYKAPQPTERGSGTMAPGKFIGYLRVSTEKQGQSGLGIEAQRKAIEDYLNGGRWELLHEYVEIESGKRSDRPELAKALAHSKATGRGAHARQTRSPFARCGVHFEPDGKLGRVRRSRYADGEPPNSPPRADPANPLCSACGPVSDGHKTVSKSSALTA